MTLLKLLVKQGRRRLKTQQYKTQIISKDVASQPSLFEIKLNSCRVIARRGQF